TTGDIHVKSEFIGKTEAHASGVAGGLVGVSITEGRASHDPTVATTVQASASLTAGSTGNVGKQIEILARHNHDGSDDRADTGALASASNAAFGLGAAISSDITATAAAD